MTNPQDKNKSSIGIGMIAIAWLLIMAAGALWYHEWAEQQYNPNQNISGNHDGHSTTIKLTANTPVSYTHLRAHET